MKQLIAGLLVALTLVLAAPKPAQAASCDFQAAANYAANVPFAAFWDLWGAAWENAWGCTPDIQWALGWHLTQLNWESGYSMTEYQYQQATIAWLQNGGN